MDNRSLNSSSPPQPTSYTVPGGGQHPQTNTMPHTLYRGGSTVPPPPSVPPPHLYQSPSPHYQYGPPTTSMLPQSASMNLGPVSQQPQHHPRGGMHFASQQPPLDNVPWSENSPSSGGSVGQPMYGGSVYGYQPGYQQQQHHTIHHRGPAPPPSLQLGLYSAPLQQQRTSRHHVPQQQQHQPGSYVSPSPGMHPANDDGLVTYNNAPPPPGGAAGHLVTQLPVAVPPSPSYYMPPSTVARSSYSTFQPGGQSMPPNNATGHQFRPQHYSNIPHSHGGPPPMQQQQQPSQMHANFLHSLSSGGSSSSVPLRSADIGLYSNSPSVNQPHYPLPTTMANGMHNYLPSFASANCNTFTTGTINEPRAEVGGYPPPQNRSQPPAPIDYFAYLDDVRSSSTTTLLSTTSTSRMDKKRRKMHGTTENTYTGADDDEHLSNNKAPPVGDAKTSAGEVISLDDLLDVALQTIYTDFTHLMGDMPNLQPVEKKTRLTSYCWQSRSYLVRFYAAYEWSTTAMPKVIKCGRLVKYCCDISDTHSETADFLALLARETLALSKLPFYQVLIAVDVLATGSYKRLPTCLRSEIAEANKLPCDRAAEGATKQKKSETLGLSTFVQQQFLRTLTGRLIQRHTLADHMRLEPVVVLRHGVVSLTVLGEFQLRLTIDSINNDDACWRIVSLSFLIPDFGISGGGSGALSLISNKSRSSLRTIGCVAPKQVAFLRDYLQTSLENRKKSLIAVYDFLHDVCSNLKLDILLTQLLQLEQKFSLALNDDNFGGDFDSLEEISNIFTATKYEPGRYVTIAYWQMSGNIIFPPVDDFDAEDEAEVDDRAVDADRNDAEMYYSVTFSYQKPANGRKPWRVEHCPSLFDQKSVKSTIEYCDAALDMNRFIPSLLSLRCYEKLRLLNYALLPWFSYARLHCQNAEDLSSFKTAPCVEITMMTSYFTNPTSISPTFAPSRSFRIFVHQYTGMYFVSRHHLPTIMHQFEPESKKKLLKLLKKLEFCLNRAFCYELLEQPSRPEMASVSVGTDQILDILLDIEKNLLKGMLIMYCQALGLTNFLPNVLESRASLITSSHLLLSGRQTSEKLKLANEALFFRLLECDDYVIVINLMPMSQHNESHGEISRIPRTGGMKTSNVAENLRLQFQATLTATNLPHFNTLLHAVNDVPRLPPYCVSLSVCVLDQLMSIFLQQNESTRMTIDAAAAEMDRKRLNFSGGLASGGMMTLSFLSGILSQSIGLPACPGCSSFSSIFLNRIESFMPKNGISSAPQHSTATLVTNKALSKSFLDPTLKLPLHQAIPWSKLPRAMPDLLRKLQTNRLVTDEKVGKGEEKPKLLLPEATERRMRRIHVDQQLRNFTKREGICLSQNLYETGTCEATDSPVSRTGNLGTELSHVLSSCVEHLPFFELQKALLGRGFTVAQPFASDGRGGGGSALTGKRGIHTLDIVRFPPAEDLGEAQFHRVFCGAFVTYVPRTTRILDPIPIGVFLVTLRFSGLLYTMHSRLADKKPKLTNAAEKRRNSLEKEYINMQKQHRRGEDRSSFAGAAKGGRNTLIVSLNYQAAQTTAEACARVAEDLETDFRAMAKIYGFLYTWWMYDKALHGISSSSDENNAENEKEMNAIHDPLVRSILSTVEVKHYDVANLSFCYRVAPLFTLPPPADGSGNDSQTTVGWRSNATLKKNDAEKDVLDEDAVAADDNALAERVLVSKSLPTSTATEQRVDEMPKSTTITDKKRTSLANLFVDCRFYRPTSTAQADLFPASTNGRGGDGGNKLPAEYEMHLSWDSRQRTFNVGLRCAAAHGIGTNPHLVIRDLLSQQLESACSMKQDRDRIWSARQYCHVVDMLYNLSVTIRPLTLLGALACRSPLIQYDPRIDFAYTVGAGRTPSGATNPTRGWYNHSPYRLRPLKPNVYRLEMCKRMRLLFVVNQYGQVLVGDEGLPIYCAYKTSKLSRRGGGAGENDEKGRVSLLMSLLDDDVEVDVSEEEKGDSRTRNVGEFADAEAAGPPPQPPILTLSGLGPPPPVSSSSSIIQSHADTSLRSLLMRPVSNTGSSSNLNSQYGGAGGGSGGLSNQQQISLQQHFLATASARPPLPPIVMSSSSIAPQQPQQAAQQYAANVRGLPPQFLQQQPTVTVPRAKSTLPLGLHFQLMRPTIYLFEFFAAWQQHLRRLTTSSKTAKEIGADAEKQTGRISIKVEHDTAVSDDPQSLPRQKSPPQDISQKRSRVFLRVSKKLDLYELETALFCFLFTPLCTLKRQLVDNDFVDRTLAGILQSLNVFSKISLFEQFMTSCYVLQMLPIWLRDEISEACQLVRPTPASNATSLPLAAATKGRLLHEVLLINDYSRFIVRFNVKSLYTELNFLATDRFGELSVAVDAGQVEDAAKMDESAVAHEKRIFQPTNLFTSIEAELLDALFRRRICITPFNVMKMASWFKLLSFGDSPLLLREILHLYFHQFAEQWHLSKMNYPGEMLLPTETNDDKNVVLNRYQQLNSVQRPREPWRWTVELCFHQPIDEFPRPLKLLEPPVMLLPSVTTNSGTVVQRVMLFFRFESKAAVTGESVGDLNALGVENEVITGKTAEPTAESTAVGGNAAENEKTGKGGVKKESAKKRKKRQTDAAAAGVGAAPVIGAGAADDSVSTNSAENSATVGGNAEPFGSNSSSVPTNFGKPRIFYLPVRYEIMIGNQQHSGGGGSAPANVVVEISDEQTVQQPLLLRVRQTYLSFLQTYSNSNAAREASTTSGAPANFKLLYLLDAIARNPLI